MAKSLPLFDGAQLRSGRVHEVFGMGARAFAAMVAGASGAPVIWAQPKASREKLNPLGLQEFFVPSVLVFAECERPLDVLWSMEEALRFGAAPVVISELAEPPDLTISRRLQLAAEAGGGLGLCLVSDRPVTNAAETRWFCAPAPCAEDYKPEENPQKNENDSTLWRLSLIKNKKGTLGAWEVAWDAAAHRIIMVSKIAGGPDLARGPHRSRPALRGDGGGKKCVEARIP